MTHEPPSPPLSIKECVKLLTAYIDLRSLKSAPIFIFLTLSNSVHVFLFFIKLCLKAEVTVQNGISLQKYFIEKKTLIVVR